MNSEKRRAPHQSIAYFSRLLGTTQHPHAARVKTTSGIPERR